MADEDAETADRLTLSDDGFSVPTVEILTGRGFVTGKSGSGKSNTVSVVAEELLAAGMPLLVVDTDGEYYGLKESFELLHVGGDERCDKRVTPDHAEQIATVALDRQVPVILDVSGYRDPDEGRELVGAVVEELFVREKQARTPFLLVVEEAHEFMPQQGSTDEVGETLIRVAKRGRKRGLGVCALSQRPAAVSKDYITQCDWLVWHRLTWDNDTQVVARILGDDAAEDVQDLDDGEAIVMTDWDDVVQRVRFRRKRTFDAGATPDLDSVDRPDFKSVDGTLLTALDDPGESDSNDDLSGGAGVDSDGEPADDDRTAGDDGSVTGNSDGTTGASAGDTGGNAATAGTATSATASGGATNSGTASGATAGAAATGGDTGRNATDAAGSTDAATPAGDPVWEAAQFVTYLARRAVETTRDAAWRTAAGLGRLGRLALAAVAARVTDTPAERRRVESLLPKLIVLAVGVALGIALAAVLT